MIFHQGEDKRIDGAASLPNTTMPEHASSYQKKKKKSQKVYFNKLCINLQDVIFHKHSYTYIQCALPI